MPETKAQIKKAVKAEKKKIKKEDKFLEKAKRKSKVLDIRKLAINYSWKEVGAFKKILSNPPTDPEALNAVLYLSNSTLPDIPRPEPTSLILKDFFGTNAKLNNS